MSMHLVCDLPACLHAQANHGVVVVKQDEWRRLNELSCCSKTCLPTIIIIIIIIVYEQPQQTFDDA